MSFEKTTAPHPDDTIVALSSAPGSGTRAIVRVSGSGTMAVVAACFTPADAATPPAKRTLQPGTLRLNGVHSPLPADLYAFAGPHSYTGQDLAELHTIASPPLVERLIADLLAAGARPATPGEFTLRAFLAGKLDLPQAEAVHAVIDAGTDADLKQALTQLAGGITRPLERLRDDLLNLLADLEAGLDFVDEDITFVSKPDALARLDDAMGQLEATHRQLEERSLSGEPIRVALVGLPNAGKSSLFNVLGGGVTALVSPVPGTTRDYLTKRFRVAEVPVELIDTAGWQDAETTIEEQAQHLGREQAGRASVLLWCVEAGQDFDPAVAAKLSATGADVLRVQTKWDRTPGVWPPGNDSPIPASVMTERGTAALTAMLAERLTALARPPLAPSQSRCRHHLERCVDDLRLARRLWEGDEPHELAALALRGALESLGEMAGAVYTNDLLDRIFSRFCIGK